MATTPTTPNTPNTPTSPTPELRPAQTDRRYYWFLIIYLVLLSALGSFVNDMYTPSLPQIARDFHSSPSQSQLSDNGHDRTGHRAADARPHFRPLRT